MALDKQRILSELGNVMNQLKSADCGCMGKLFSNPGQSNAAMPNTPQSSGGCRHGCCHGHGCSQGHGYSALCAGEPYSAMNPHSMNRHCMGHCNPPELYSNTYNYLNENLMQPVVKEVYNDLKDISPVNAVMNNPMAKQMGLAVQENGETIGGEMGNAVMQNSNMHMNMPNNVRNEQHMGSMGTMGPQILNMMMGDGKTKPSSSPEQSRPLTGPMIIDAPQSPHGQVGVTPINSANQGQYAGLSQNVYNMGQEAQGSHMQNPTTHQNMYNGSNTQSFNNVQGNVPQDALMGKINANSAAQQMAASHHSYGQHSQGIAKFNEMFPGVMQGLGGDLNFDPMAIAIQMNPANHKTAAMNTMQKIMNGNGMSRGLEPAAVMPTIGGVNTTQPNNQTQQNIPPCSQSAYSSQLAPTQQQGVLNAEAVATPPNTIPQQQVYTSLTGSPAFNQQQQMQTLQQQQQTKQYQQSPQQDLQNPQLQHLQHVPQYQQPKQPLQQTSHLQQQQNAPQYQQPLQQQMVDPNTGTIAMPVTLPNAYHGIAGDPNVQPHTSTEPPDQGVIKEPIFPVDTSKHQAMPFTKQPKYYEYNTLGQPVEMLPARNYHYPEPNLPQTLSPQPTPIILRNDQTRYSNVKSTVSKTSLMGNRPIGKTPSRSQLQQVYNQYKGSQSYTQQNIREPGHGNTFSEGNLNVTHNNANQRQVPIEKVGGDSKANDQVIHNQIQNKQEHVGDGPVNSKHQGDGAPLKAPPTKQAKCRNGLQDMVYTSYPSSAAWSFHGNCPPAAPTYRFRRRA